MRHPTWKWAPTNPTPLQTHAAGQEFSGHPHYSNPFRPDRLITFAWHPGDVPRGIIADIVEDLGITRDEFHFGKF
jgi:hypothetical protein